MEFLVISGASATLNFADAASIDSVLQRCRPLDGRYPPNTWLRLNDVSSYRVRIPVERPPATAPSNKDARWRLYEEFMKEAEGASSHDADTETPAGLGLEKCQHLVRRLLVGQCFSLAGELPCAPVICLGTFDYTRSQIAAPIVHQLVWQIFFVFSGREISSCRRGELRRFLRNSI